MIWGSVIRLWFIWFLCKTLPKRLKFNKGDIYIFKVKKNSTRKRCEICSKLTIKTPNGTTFIVLVSLLLSWTYFTPWSSFSILTLNNFMPADNFCIHFRVYRGVHFHIFHIFSHFKEEHSCKTYCNVIKITLLHGYSFVNMLHICSRTFF